MSARALFGDKASRVMEAKTLEELQSILFELLTSGDPFQSPIVFNNRTNGPALKIVNTGRDSESGVLIRDADGRQTQLGLGLGSRGIVASEIIPDRNFAIDPDKVKAHYAGENVGSGLSPTQGFWTALTGVIKGGWGRFFDSYILSEKTWHPPRTADQFSMNGNRKWMPSDPCGWAIIHCRVVTVNADTLTCIVIDDSSGSDPAGIIGSTVTVCKPWWLMRTPFDGQTVDGITYTYSSHQRRTANNGVTTETQVVHPYYKASDTYGDPSEIYARWSCNGTDVTSVWYIDVNADARTWVVE